MQMRLLQVLVNFDHQTTRHAERRAGCQPCHLGCNRDPTHVTQQPVDHTSSAMQLPTSVRWLMQDTCRQNTSMFARCHLKLT